MLCKHLHFVIDFKIPSNGLSAGAIAGIVVGSLAFVMLILFVLWKMGYLCGKDQTDKGKIEVQNNQNRYCPYDLIIL
jgi:hypothetical protein